MSQVLNTIRSADLVVAVGSVDGVLTTAAVMRLSNNPNLEVVFTQAFQVDRLPVESWENRRVIFVDLAVNNRDREMTVRFIERLRAGGNTILAIIDEHDRDAWFDVLGGLDGLAVEPQTRDQADLSTPQSSGEVLRRALGADGEYVDDHVAELVWSADEADQGCFNTVIGDAVNRAVKSAIADNGRRVYLVKLFSRERRPDTQVEEWIAEYQEMERNATILLAEAVEPLGDNIVQVNTGGRKLDVTSFLFALYKRARVVVIVGVMAYDKTIGRQVPTAFIATGDRGLDVLAIVRAAGIAAGGMSQKATSTLSGWRRLSRLSARLSPPPKKS